MTERKLGLRPPKNAPALMLAPLLTKAVPDYPATGDHFSNVFDWGLYENDKYGDCVAPDTRVLTGDLRWARAGDLAVGDRLLAFDEESSGHGRCYRSAVVEKAHVVRRPCYDLTFEDGTVVRSSSGHRWLTSSTVQRQLRTQRWARTEDLISGPVRQTKVIKPLEVWDVDESRDAGYLAAAFDGEGNLEQTRHGMFANRVCFSQTDNEMLTEVERCLKALGYRHNHTVTSPGTRLRVDGTPRKEKHRIEVSPRSEYVRFLGSVRPARLLPKVDLDRLGRIDGDAVRLVRKEYVGEQDVVMLDTSARTYIAEGLASHNCGPTSVANYVKLVTRYLTGTEVSVTQDDVFDLYRRSGNPNFDPTTDADDNGVDMQTMLEALAKGGIGGGHKPVAFAKVNAGNLDEVRAAIAIFGGVLLGVNLEVAQQTQTDDGGPWDYDASGTWGGHAVLAGRYTSASTGTDVSVVTWAEVMGTTDAFLKHQLGECWVVVLPEHLQNPAFLAGVDVAMLAADYQALTGRPFPVQPTPTPTPTDPPGPGPDPLVDADVELAKAFRADGWVSRRHSGDNADVAEAAAAWLQAKGL